MNDVIKHRLPIYGQSQLDDIEAELAAFEAEERKRLGLDDEEKTFWTDEMIDADFKKSEKATITMLVGGLTVAQDFLIEAAEVETLGQLVERVRTNVVVEG